MARWAALAVAVLSGLSGPIAAQTVGPTFRVNTYTTGFQYQARIAHNADGRFVVLWFHNAYPNAIDAQRFDASGAPLGPQFRVNTGTDFIFGNAGVAARGNAFLVVWNMEEGPDYRVHGRLYSFDGPPISGEFRVSAASTGWDYYPSVTSGPGGFVVVWTRENFGQVPITYGIHGRRFDGAGNPLTGDFLIGALTTANTVYGPEVGADAAGNFVTLWQDDQHVIRVQRFLANGSPNGAPYIDVSAGSTSAHFESAIHRAGGFVVAWEASDGSGTGIIGQRFDAAGAETASFRVNVETTGTQYHPQVAADASGAFLVTWRIGNATKGRFFQPSGISLTGDFTVGSFVTDGLSAAASGELVAAGPNSNGDIAAQRLAAPPLPVGGEFRVNTSTGSFNVYPSVVEDASGSFAVAWFSGPGFAFRRFSAAGVPLGSELAIPAANSGSVSSLASDSAGGFVLVWDQLPPADATLDVFAQRISSSGAALGSPFRVNTSTAQAHSRPWAASSAGGFVVVWMGAAGDGSGKAALGRRFASSGTPLGPEFIVSSITTNDQIYPSVAGNSSGGFVVAWQVSPSAFRDLYVRRFAASGAPLDGDLAVNESMGPLARNALAVGEDGSFVVAWDSLGIDGSSYGILAQPFSADALPLGGNFHELRVNTYTTGGQVKPSASVDPSGRFVIAWQGALATGTAVFEQVYDRTGEPIGANFRVNTATSSTARPSVALGKTWITAWDQSNGSSSDIQALLLTPPCFASDADRNGAVNVADVLYLINYLFAGGPPPLCGGDADGSGAVNVSDVLYLINYLFAGGPPPA